MGEYDRLPYGKALLALFLSSVLQTVLFVVVAVLLDVGVLAGLILAIFVVYFVGAVLLRLCLRPFGWTISIKAAALTRLVCGLLSGLTVRAIAVGPGPLLVAGLLELLTSAAVITFFATRVEEIDTKPEWAPPSERPDALGEATVYSAEDFLADSARGRR